MNRVAIEAEEVALVPKLVLAFYDFPAEHWIHLRTSNPIESTFAPVRARTDVTKGVEKRRAALDDWGSEPGSNVGSGILTGLAIVGFAVAGRRRSACRQGLRRWPNRQSNPRKEKPHGQPVRVEGERSNCLLVPPDALDWGYEALSAVETHEFVRMLQAEGLARGG
jgi:hypothetical protein